MGVITMTHFRVIALFSVLAWPAIVLANEDFATLLPGTPVSGRVMRLVAPPDIEAISERLLMAIREQPKWFKGFLAEHDIPGKPLPFHPNFRVTRAEYEKLLGASGRMILREVRRVSLRAVREVDGSVTLTTEPADFPLNGFVVSADGSRVTTQFGRLNTKSAINQTDTTSPTGSWIGTQWKYELVQGARVKSVKFAIGKRAAGDGILYFDLKDISQSGREESNQIILFPLLK